MAYFKFKMVERNMLLLFFSFKISKSESKEFKLKYTLCLEQSIQFTVYSFQRWGLVGVIILFNCSSQYLKEDTQKLQYKVYSPNLRPFYSL